MPAPKPAAPIRRRPGIGHQDVASQDATATGRRRSRLFMYCGMFVIVRSLAKRAGAERDRYRRVLC